MSTELNPPPPPEVCLTRPYKSRAIKGGTIVAEDVLDLETHRARLLDPDDYRQVVHQCRACQGTTIHAHCFRSRVLRPAKAHPSVPPPVVSIRLFQCAEETCRAVFTILPAFLARHLHRVWQVVEQVTKDEPVTKNTVEAPVATQKRWLARLGSSAAQLRQLLLMFVLSGAHERLSALAHECTRSELISALVQAAVLPSDRALGCLAAWVHRLLPGVRVM